MMEQCQACFEVLPGQYIAPAHLPKFEAVEEDTQVFWQGATANVVAELHYEFLHEGVLRAMLCGIGRHAAWGAAYWAYGTCFYDVKYRTAVRIKSMMQTVDSGGGTICVEAAGVQARELADKMVSLIKDVKVGRAPSVVWRPEEPRTTILAEPTNERFKVHTGIPANVPLELLQRLCNKNGILVFNGGITVGGNSVEITGSQGVVIQQGGHNTLSDNTVSAELQWTQAAAAINLDQLAMQLAVLLRALKSAAQDQEELRSVVAVGDAEIAAQKGHRESLFRHLKVVGGWALDAATKIGTTVAAKAIEIALNMK